MQRARVVVAALVVAGGITSVVTADPPRPGTEENGLTENETATLWSRDTDDYITQSAYRERYGENRTAVQQVANGTDVTFTRPPATAATWTRHDFQDLDGGGPNTSVHPPHANRTDGAFIADAHATIFAVQPSTRTHLAAGTTPLYIAPNGTLRGFVDYRVRVPPGDASGSTTVDWSLVSHEIDTVELQADGESLVERDGAHTPILAYQMGRNGRATLTFTAEIDVRLRQTTRIDRGNTTSVDVTYHEESVNVSDTLPVAVYNLSATAHSASYPNGDAGVAVFQTRPWQGFTLPKRGARVRGIWRFYTARNPDWDTLVTATATGRSVVDSPALPVAVHAYPSRIGPRVEPVRDGPELLSTWGGDQATPAGTIGENVSVDVVNQSYQATYGLAARTESIERESLHVTGIVRGVNETVALEDDADRQLRRSTLSVNVVRQNQTAAVLRVELRDAQTDAPIQLADRDRLHLIGGETRTGAITINGQRTETNRSGVATVTVDEPGVYTARYQPGSWLSHDPAYAPATATARWHPLGSIDGWFALLVGVGWRLLPFAVVFYAGTRLLRLLGFNTRFQES
jgi:hypothetical protein